MFNKLKILPNWCLSDENPAFYDTESATALEQTAKLHAAMIELQEDYNKFAENIENSCEDFKAGIIKNEEEFEAHINKIVHDYIALLDTKVEAQDKLIADTIVYIKENVSEATAGIITEMKDNGELSAAILDSFSDLDTRATSLDTRVTTAEADIDSVETRATTLESIATTLETRATDLESRATDLESRASISEGAIETLETRADGVDTRCDTIEENIATVEGTLDAHETAIEDIKSDLVNYKVKGDFAVVEIPVSFNTEDIPDAADDTTIVIGSAAVPFPEGFTKDNCVVTSVMRKSVYPDVLTIDNYMWGTTVDGSTMLTDLIVSLGTPTGDNNNVISVQAQCFYGYHDCTHTVRVVLMKV